jgi:hypothetical protein
MLAAQSGHCESIKTLLDARANVMLQDNGHSITALHTAALFDHRDACVLLLRGAAASATALLDMKASDGETALRLAEDAKHVATAQLLRDWPAIDAFAAGSRKRWLTLSASPKEQQKQQKQQQQAYCWVRSPLFDQHLINEITSFLTDDAAV